MYFVLSLYSRRYLKCNLTPTLMKLVDIKPPVRTSHDLTYTNFVHHRLRANFKKCPPYGQYRYSHRTKRHLEHARTPTKRQQLRLYNYCDYHNGDTATNCRSNIRYSLLAPRNDLSFSSPPLLPPLLPPLNSSKDLTTYLFDTLESQMPNRQHTTQGVR